MYSTLAEPSEAVTTVVYEFTMASRCGPYGVYKHTALGGNLTDVIRIRADRFRNKFNRMPVKFEF